MTWDAAGLLSAEVLSYCCRVSLEATLLSCDAAHVVTQADRQAEKVEDATAAATAAVDSPAEASSLTEHRLQLSYSLLNGEAISSGPIMSTGGSAAASAAVTDVTSPLCWSATHQLAVNEALLHAAASSHAAFPIMLTVASRNVAKVPPAAASAIAAKPAKPGKAAAAPEEAPWQPDQQCTLPIDLAALLVGDTDLVSEWPQKGLALPPQLQAYSRIKFCVQVVLCIPNLEQSVQLCRTTCTLGCVYPIHMCVVFQAALAQQD